MDRDTGLYQDAYDQIGLGFGDGGAYFSRLLVNQVGDGSAIYMNVVDETETNADLIFSPKGTGSVRVGGQSKFTVSDVSLLIENAQGPKVRFEAGQVGTGTSTRIMTFPQISQGSGTTLVGADTLNLN